MKKRKIYITGVSGFVGRELVNTIDSCFFEIYLIGRDPEALKHQYPDLKTISYGDLNSLAHSVDTFIHLAVVNNNSKLSERCYSLVNTNLLEEMALVAKSLGVKKFVHIMSFQCLNPRDKSRYVVSKMLGQKKLGKIKGLNTQTIYAPLIWGQTWPGKLRLLNVLPRNLSLFVFSLLSSIKPTLYIGTLSSKILERKFDTGSSILLSDEQNLFFMYHVIKRLFDIFVSLVLLALLAIPLCLLWFLILYSSPGPGIFVQHRVGRYGRGFKCFKFRSMYDSAPQAGTHEVSAKYITGIGAVIRRFKIDELPQLVNVLLGRMTLVGPRPCLEKQSELIDLREKNGIFAVLPGITGWAQINGVDMSEPGKLVEYDKEYIVRRSLLFDIEILYKTMFRAR